MKNIDISLLLSSVKINPSEDFESEEIEFKCYADEKSLHGAKELAEEVSAIANKRGGVIVIGVVDSSNVPNGEWEKQLSGFDQVDELQTQERILGKLSNKIPIKVSNHEFESNNYVVISVPHQSDTLVTTSSGKVCIREGRSSRPMTPEEIQGAVKSLSSYDWSSEVVSIDCLDAIDVNALEEAKVAFCEKRGID